MNNQPIGILDSGVGGLSIWKEVVKQLPSESTIYIADSKNCPYGTRPVDTIYPLAKRLVQFLVDKKVKIIVVACNTITVSCLDRLRKEFPDTPIVGTVPVIKTAATLSKNKKIGVLSTKTTAESIYQKQLINTFSAGCDVLNIGTDKLVPVIENGEIDKKDSYRVLKSILRPFIEKNVDALVLGCSHFPFLKKEMKKILGLHVMILDSADAIARQTARVLTNNNALSLKKDTEYQFYTTGDVDQFEVVANKLIGGVTIAGNVFYAKI